MRFSEAIMLGFTELKPKARCLAKSGSACALGAGYHALGLLNGKARIIGFTHNESTEIFLNTPILRYPCMCTSGVDCYDTFLINENSIRGAIAHIFNEHVMVDKTWTLERLVDWVRSVEPEEKQEEVKETVNENREYSEVLAG